MDDPQGRSVSESDLRPLLGVMRSLCDGDFSARAATEKEGILGEIAGAFNQIAARNDHLATELRRVRREVAKEGRLDERISASPGPGSWTTNVDETNQLLTALATPLTKATRVLESVADGDLTQHIDLRDGHRLEGDLGRLGNGLNRLVDQLSMFSGEVTRVAREVGTEGRLGGQAVVRGVSGTWKDLTDNVNYMASNLTSQVRNIAQVATAIADGDLSQKITVDARGEILELKTTVNKMVDNLSSFADEVTRVAREVGTEGKLGGQAQVKGVAGTWKELTDNVNSMADNLTDQVRNIAQVTTAVAKGDLSQKITVDAR